MIKDKSDPFEMLLKGNFEYQWKIIQGEEDVYIEGKIPRYPVLILTCMDPRIDVHRIFQLKPGDVFVLRNAGNYITDDVLRALLMAIHMHNIKYIIVLGHTNCEITKLRLTELKEQLYPSSREYIIKSGTNILLQLQRFFRPFYDELKNVNEQAERLINFKGIPQDVEITSMIYDVDTGWVFEYDMIKNLKLIEDFKKSYQDLLTKKRIKLIDFFESIEEEIIKGKEIPLQNHPHLSEEQKIVYKEKTAPLYKILYNNNIENQAKISRVIELSPITKSQVHIPKVVFPKIKINIPRVYRRKR